MRVTNSMLVSNFMNDLNNSMNRMGKLQTQMTNNRKYAHISDDPVSVIYSQQARYKLHRLGQYQDNVDMAQSWLTSAETSVLDLNEVAKAAYESLIDARTDVKSGTDRQNVAKYLGQLRDHVLQDLNSTFGDKYIFGGYNTTGYVENGELVTPFGYVDKPVYADPSDPTSELLYTERRLTFHGIDMMTTDPAEQTKLQELFGEKLTFDIGPGQEMDVTVNGIDLVSFKYGAPPNDEAMNLYNLLDEVMRYVNDPDNSTQDIPDELISKLQSGQNHLLNLTADIGGRTSRLDLVQARYERDEINYTQMKSDAEDADQAELIMQYKMAEAVYKAALSTGAYIIQPTLMDFLR